jgi:hypothetical protein
VICNRVSPDQKAVMVKLRTTAETRASTACRINPWLHEPSKPLSDVSNM